MAKSSTQTSFLEGHIGQLQHATFTNNATLEVLGENGKFRINVAKMRSSKIRKAEKSGIAIYDSPVDTQENGRNNCSMPFSSGFR